MKTQTTSKKNTARLTAALFALILLFPCCMDSGSGGSSSDSSDTIVAPAEPAPDNSGNDDSTDDNGDDSGKTEPAEPNPDTPDDSENITEIDSNTDMSNLNPAKTYIFKATNGTVDAAKLVYAKKILGENLSLTETNVNYTLDFSNKSFANTTDEIESRSEYASKKGISKSENIITDENLTETIKIGDVEFITKPIYNGESGSLVQQAFKFGKNVNNVKVTFGNEHSMTEAYKGGIILENPNVKITSDDVNSATLTGYVYTETMNGLSDNSLMSRLTKDSDLPILNFKFVFLNDTENFYGTGVDKIFENYYRNGASDKILVKSSSAPFNAKDALNGGYMYDKNGNYNNNAYNIDINTALLMAEKLTNEIQNVNISGNVTSDVDTGLTPSNVRFSGDVSGLKFTLGGDAGIIDFVGVGPKKISAPSAKIVVKGVGDEGKFLGRVVDLSSLSKDVLSKVSTKSQDVRKVYLPTDVEKSNFTGGYAYSEYDNGSSASTNRAWEEAGRNGTLPSDSLSKLDVKAKANNPLLQKLLDENCPVYG